MYPLQSNKAGIERESTFSEVHHCLPACGDNGVVQLWDTADLPCLPCRDVHWLQRPEHGPGDAPQRKGGGLRDRGGIHQHFQAIFQRGERTFSSLRNLPLNRKDNLPYRNQQVLEISENLPAEQNLCETNLTAEISSVFFPRLELNIKLRSNISRH